MLHPFLDVSPTIPDTAFVAPSADVIGDVVLGDNASVWYNATLRGDVNWIRIGACSNVQDNAVVHVSNRVAPTRIGAHVTVGHSAVVHGCTIHDRVLVGMGAVIMDNAVVGPDVLIGARALITGGTQIPPRSLVLGSPAKVVRALTDEELGKVARYAARYVKYGAIYRGVSEPANNPFYNTSAAPDA